MLGGRIGCGEIGGEVQIDTKPKRRFRVAPQALIVAVTRNVGTLLKSVIDEIASSAAQVLHSHVYLGEKHADSERKTWVVIALCGAMMIAEIVGGLLFRSIALVD